MRSTVFWVEFSVVRRKSDISGNISPPSLGMKNTLNNKPTEADVKPSEPRVEDRAWYRQVQA
jgi:hypothetical protein